MVRCAVLHAVPVSLRRGISIIEDPSAAYFKKSGNDTIVQQLVRPYLIGNRLWWVGGRVRRFWWVGGWHLGWVCMCV